MGSSTPMDTSFGEDMLGVPELVSINEEPGGMSAALEGEVPSSRLLAVFTALATEIGSLYGLDERISKTLGADRDEFLLEIGALLSELGCPHEELYRGHLENRLATVERRRLLLNYLLHELRAARLFAHKRLKQPVETAPSKPSTLFITRLIDGLGADFPKAYTTLEFTAFFADLKKRAEGRLVQCHKPPQPLFKAKLDASKWSLVEATAKALTTDYRMRNTLIIKRADVTLNSFLWPDKAKKHEEAVLSMWMKRRASLQSFVPVLVPALLAATDDVLRVRRVGDDGKGGRRVKGKRAKPEALSQPPADRGGRTDEVTPLQKETYTQQDAMRNRGGFGGRGGRGGGGRGRGRGDSRGSGPGRSYEQQTREEWEGRSGKAGGGHRGGTGGGYHGGHGNGGYRGGGRGYSPY